MQVEIVLGGNVAAADLYRDIPEYRLTRPQRRLRFPDATHGWHWHSIHRHVRDLVHGRCDGTRQHVVAAFSWRALAPNSSIPRTGGMAESIVVYRRQSVVFFQVLAHQPIYLVAAIRTREVSKGGCHLIA